MNIEEKLEKLKIEEKLYYINKCGQKYHVFDVISIEDALQVFYEEIDEINKQNKIKKGDKEMRPDYSHEPDVNCGCGCGSCDDAEKPEKQKVSYIHLSDVWIENLVTTINRLKSEIDYLEGVNESCAKEDKIKYSEPPLKAFLSRLPENLEVIDREFNIQINRLQNLLYK